MTTPLKDKNKEIDWIINTLKGDHKAFQYLVEQYSRLVYNHIYRMSNSPDLADELTQEVFVKIYQKLNTFDQTKPFKPWLLRIASNTTLSAFRKQNKIVSLDALKESGQWKESDPSPDTSDLIEAQLSNEALLKMMNALDIRYRTVLLLRYKEELSYDEISETMNTPINTIRTWLKRGKDALQKEFTKQNKGS